MKILLLNNCHFRRGGADAVYLSTADLLRQNGHEVKFFSIQDPANIPAEEESYFIPKSVDVKLGFIKKARNFSNYFYNPQSAKLLSKLLKEFKPDIAHIHLYIGGLTSSILPVLKKHQVPVVASIHDYRFVCPAYTFLNGKNEICEQCKTKNYFSCFQNRCSKNNLLESGVMAMEMFYRNAFFHPARYIDGFIYVSEFARLKHFEFDNQFAGKLNTVLYNFSEKGQLSLEKKPWFLYFGRLSREKGMFTLLQSFLQRPDYELKIAGTGAIENELKVFVDENKMLNVDFLGYKTGKELQNLISDAGFVIVPSEWYENNPLSIIESYTLGTPVIGANIGGIPEIVPEGKTGFTFNSRNASDLVKILDKAKGLSTTSYDDICKNVSTFAFENFNKDKYIDKLMQFYMQVINHQ